MVTTAIDLSTAELISVQYGRGAERVVKDTDNCNDALYQHDTSTETILCYIYHITKDAVSESCTLKLVSDSGNSVGIYQIVPNPFGPYSIGMEITNAAALKDPDYNLVEQAHISAIGDDPLKGFLEAHADLKPMRFVHVDNSGKVCDISKMSPKDAIAALIKLTCDKFQ